MNKRMVRWINRLILIGLLLPMWAPPARSNPAILVAFAEVGISAEVLTTLQGYLAYLSPLLEAYIKLQPETVSSPPMSNDVIDHCLNGQKNTMSQAAGNYTLTVGVEANKTAARAAVIGAAKSSFPGKPIESQTKSGTYSGAAVNVRPISKMVNEAAPKTEIEGQAKAIAIEAAWTQLANAEIERLYSSGKTKARLFTVEPLPKNYAVTYGQDFARIEFPLNDNSHLFAEIRAVKQQAGSALADCIAEMRVQEQIKEHIPGYREYRRDVLNYEIKVLTDINSADPIERISGALDLRRLGSYDVIFDGPFDHAQHELLKRLYNKDGSLRSLLADRSFESAAAFTKGFTKSALQWIGVKSKIIKEVISAPKFQPTSKHGSHRHKGMPSDILDRARANPKNALYEEVIRVGEAGDLPTLNSLRYNYSYDPIVERLTREYLNRWNQVIYDSKGVVRVGSKDPLYQNLVKEGKLKNIVKDPSLRKDLNKILLGRHHFKQTLHQRWEIADSAPECVHQALYRILESPAFISRENMVQELRSILNEAVSTQDLNTLESAFCLKNGELKEVVRSNQLVPHNEKLLGLNAEKYMNGAGASAQAQPTIPVVPNSNSSMPMPPEFNGPELEPEKTKNEGGSSPNSLAPMVEAKESVVAKNVANPLQKIRFTDKVKAQMQQEDYHSFPGSVEAFGTEGNVCEIKGGDGIFRKKIEIKGSYMGKDGIFEYIVEPDGITCNHRLFKAFYESKA